MKYFVGIDPSVRSTGLVVIRVEKQSEVMIWEGVLKTPKDMRGFERLSYILEKVLFILEQHPPEMIVIEGYAYSSKNLAPSVELGTVLRWFILQNEWPLKICAPNTLKKFVTGSGNAAKEFMLLKTFKRWGIEFTDNNTCDAHGLARMAVADVRGPDIDWPIPMKEALEKLSPCN